MFPLSVRNVGGYKFGQRTWYGTKHLGVDYSAKYVPLFAPKNGTIVKAFWGTEGGNTIWFQPDGGAVQMRFMHLKSILVSSGHVSEGQQIAVTGNTGLYTTGAHLHLDIAKYWQGAYWNNFNNFIDPETYAWGTVTPPPTPTGYPKKVTVSVSKLFIRTAPNTSAPLGGDKFLLRGTTITVNGVVTGQSVSGNNQWYKTTKGNFCWSGGFCMIQHVLR